MKGPENWRGFYVPHQWLHDYLLKADAWWTLNRSAMSNAGMSYVGRRSVCSGEPGGRNGEKLEGPGGAEDMGVGGVTAGDKIKERDRCDVSSRGVYWEDKLRGRGCGECRAVIRAEVGGGWDGGRCVVRLASEAAWASGLWHSRNNSGFLIGTCTPMYGYRFAARPPCNLLAR